MRNDLDSDKKKQIEKIVSEKLKQGINREDILSQILEEYKDESLIRSIIALTPNKKNTIRFKYLNYLLIVGLLLNGFIKLIFGFVKLSEISLKVIPLAFLLPIIEIILAYYIAKQKYYGYLLLTLLYINLFLKPLGDFSNITLYGIVYSILLFSVMILSLFMKFKLFPNYGLLLPKKDDNRNILLG